MFHIGTLNILRRTKEQCEYLIVGISTDDLVESYKNKKPIIPFEERVEIVQSIEFVDLVVAQENRDKIEVPKKLQFDVMFVGDDWKGKPLFMEVENVFKQIGVDVIYFPYTLHISSTILRNKLDNI